MLKREISGFLIIGLFGAVVDFGLFNVLLGYGWEPIPASVFSVTAAGILVFFGNLLLSFRHVEVASKRSAAAKFFLLALLTVMVNNLLVGAAITQIGDPSVLQVNLIKAFVILGLMALRFLVMKFVVYVR